MRKLAGHPPPKIRTHRCNPFACNDLCPGQHIKYFPEECRLKSLNTATFRRKSLAPWRAKAFTVFIAPVAFIACSFPRQKSSILLSHYCPDLENVRLGSEPEVWFWNAVSCFPHRRKTELSRILSPLPGTL